LTRWGLIEDIEVRARDLWTCCSNTIRGSSGSRYLDIASGAGHNAVIFGSNYREIVCLDIWCSKGNALKKSGRTHLVRGDGNKLPIDSSRFDMVTLFSFIEHVPNSKHLLKEVFRVLKKKGICIIQMPNRFFPIELHTKLPFIDYIPKRILNFLIKKTIYGWLTLIDIPSPKKVLKEINELEPQAQIIIKKMNYSTPVIPANLRSIYNFVLQVGILSLIPLGYVIIVKK